MSKEELEKEKANCEKTISRCKESNKLLGWTVLGCAAAIFAGGYMVGLVLNSVLKIMMLAVPFCFVAVSSILGVIDRNDVLIKSTKTQLAKYTFELNKIKEQEKQLQEANNLQNEKIDTPKKEQTDTHKSKHSYKPENNKDKNNKKDVIIERFTEEDFNMEDTNHKKR